MEQGSKERGLPPQLLNLIPEESDCKKVREAGDHGGRSSRAGAIFDAAGDEDLKLELKLGLPGIQREEDGESCSVLSLGCFPANSRLAKRGFFDTVEAKPEGT
jgi:auxin-responsive protein IAA